MTTDNRTKFREALEAYRTSTDETRAAATDVVDNAVIDLELDAADEVRNGTEISEPGDFDALHACLIALGPLDATMRDRALRAARAILLPTPPSFGERYADTLKELMPLLAPLLAPKQPGDLGAVVDGPDPGPEPAVHPDLRRDAYVFYPGSVAPEVSPIMKREVMGHVVTVNGKILFVPLHEVNGIEIDAETAAKYGVQAPPVA